MTTTTWKGWASGAATLAGAACLIASPASAQQALYGYDYNSYQNAPQYSASPTAIAVAPATNKRVSVVRGDDLADDGVGTRPQEWSPSSRGFSIRINPSADLAPVEPVTTVTVGGYAKGDIIYDTHNDVGDSFVLLSAAPDTAPDREHFRAHASQSRIRVRSRTDLPNDIQVRTLVEGDFEGGLGSGPFTSLGGAGVATNQTVSNSTAFRLRHAWGSISRGPWTLLIGQTWTNFMSLHSYPDTVDFFGPTGALFKRQGQIELRYAGDNFTFEIAAENPEFSGVDFGATSPPRVSANIRESTGGNSIDQIPDFTAAFQFQHNLGAISSDIRVAGIVGQNRNQDNTVGALVAPFPVAPDDPGVGSDNEFKWGIHAGAAFSAGPARLFANVAYTDGAGSYQLFGFSDGDVGTAGGLGIAATAAGSAEQIFNREVLTIWGSLAYDLTETLTVNLVGGYADEDRATIALGLADREGFSFHGNVWYTPADAYRLGFEVTYQEFETDGNPIENSNTRIQFAGQFFF